MLLTLTTPTVPYAAAMSEATWRLSVPAPDSFTTQAFPVVLHPETGDAALWIPDAFTTVVHAAANVAAFVAALPVPQSERDALAAVLEAARGGAPLTVADWLPPTLQARALTDAQAAAAGWFPSP